MLVNQQIELPEPEVSFVRAVADGHSPSLAAVMGGFTAAHACNLMRRPRILAAILALKTNCEAALAKIERKNVKADAKAAS
ncbi:MAG: hypothetical protein ACREDA_06265 [Methylocella sp.]